MSVRSQEGLALGKPAWLPPANPMPAGWLDKLPPAADCLRDYQRDLISNIAEALDAGRKRPLCQAPTGAGKTHIMAAITLAAPADRRVLILATRTRLVRQIHERLDAFDVRHGVIAASLKQLRNYSSRIQIASMATLYRRAIVNQHIPLPAADVVIFDEAHLAAADSPLKILSSYPGAILIGLTATPARKSGKSLATAFDCLILGPSVKDLTAVGVLVPTRIFNTPSVTAAQLRALPKGKDNDFKVDALEGLLNRPKLIGDVVSNWLRNANGKRTICFAVNKAHGAALCESFRQQGIAAELLTDADDEETRDEVIARLEAGTTRVVINCFLMSYGVDVPSVECIILARPTRSLTMYLQMVGRGLRASPGKQACIVIDHGHVVESLGLPQSEFDWTLDATRNVNAETLKARGSKSAKEAMRTCSQCAAIWLTSEQGNTCPECGWAPAPKAKPIAVQEADLEELAEAPDVVSPNHPDVELFYREACDWYARRWPDRWAATPGKGRWWAWMQTQAKFGIEQAARKPSSFWNLAPKPPSAASNGWLRHRLIKAARDRARATAA